MNLLSHDLLTALLAAAQPPCLSLYQPTHRHHPGNQQDPIRFRLDNLDRVAEAAAPGRIGTLLIEAGRQIAGRLDAASGRVTLEALDHPESDDLLDDLGELVRSKGGEVAVIPAE